ncbi:HNH endonuclease [Streptacidiphilus sp. EB103A]|uniref:HNH endonuclease n=1 Tax=Streptacidiphilus sp. EB103A TaxID=3156275 RepID=UPI00351222B3
MDEERRAWIAAAVAQDLGELRAEMERLDGTRAGRRFKPRNLHLGWTERVEAQTAYVEAVRLWIEHLHEPDKWLLRFLERPDFGQPGWQMKYNTRRGDFIRKHAWEPTAERQRTGYAKKRRKDAGRRQLEREQRTEPINRAAIYERDGGLCGICGLPVPADGFHLDHITPLSLGGAHGPENLRVTHEVCNTDRGNGWSTRRMGT